MPAETKFHGFADSLDPSEQERRFVRHYRALADDEDRTLRAYRFVQGEQGYSMFLSKFRRPGSRTRYYR